ncbi:hypothetical protein [Pseudomonas sp. SMN5]|uniref:hypothetical protein n=1 Tax=Pseudomonas sp. SMN5 TaxID=3390198 RepID=UPI003F85A92F
MSEVKTLATLVLGGAWDATELGENDIQPESKLIEELQQRLITGFDDVHIQLVDRADFDRVTAENQALQQRLTTADQRNDELETQLADREQSRRAWFDQCQSLERAAPVSANIIGIVPMPPMEYDEP